MIRGWDEGKSFAFVCWVCGGTARLFCLSKLGKLEVFTFCAQFGHVGSPKANGMQALHTNNIALAMTICVVFVCMVF